MIDQYIYKLINSKDDSWGDRDPGFEMVVVFSIVFGSLCWMAFGIAMAGNIPLHYKHVLGYSGAATLLVGYILSAFSGAKNEYERHWALAAGTLGFPGLIIVSAIIVFIRLLYYPLLAFLKIQSLFLKGHDLINGKAAKQFSSWNEKRKEKKAHQKQKKLQKKAQEKVRVTSKGAYRIPAPNCKECGQELPPLLNEYNQQEQIQQA